jgi:hypothetical protein
MAAESGGRSDAKNPRSTALGAYQFIKSTFLEIVRRHFPGEVAGLSEEQILRLRTDADFSRRAAAAFCRESIAYLKAQGLEPTFAHLRLAYLLGPGDAARVMQASAQTPVGKVLSASVIRANPFMRRMSVADLIAKSERDVTHDRKELVAEAPQPRSRPSPQARRRLSGKAKQRTARSKPCDPRRASCHRFLALQEKAKKKGDRT